MSTYKASDTEPTGITSWHRERAHTLISHDMSIENRLYYVIQAATSSGHGGAGKDTFTVLLRSVEGSPQRCLCVESLC